MKFQPSRRVRAGALIALAGACVAAGIAYASVPDSDGVIHGCYAKDGSLRVVDTDASQSCDKKETSLTWNQTGPAGPVGATGATGETGATGPAGPPGPSNAYVNYGTNMTIGERLTVTVASVTLPRGSYTLSASVDVFPTDSDDGDPTVVVCTFVSAGTLNGHFGLASVKGEIGDTMPIIGDVTITTDTAPVFLRCEPLINSAHVYRPELIATQVGAITPSE